VSEFTFSNALGEASDTGVLYGLGGRVAVGASGQNVIGLEYLVENLDDFSDSGTDFDNDEVALRYDFRF
jgi:hypothetical protein